MSSGPSVTIRRAVRGDTAVACGVLQSAFAEFQSLYTPEAYAATAVDEAGFLARLREGPVWVAVHEGSIVATTAVVHTDAGLYIRGMATVPTMRRLGVSKGLLEHVERFARAGGYARLFLRTTSFLLDAIRLYERFGFRRVEEEPPPELFGTPLFRTEKALGRRCGIGER